MPARSPNLQPGADSKWLGHRRLPLFIAVPLWIIVAGLALVAVLRLVAWDDFEPFAVANALDAVCYLPAWIVLIVAGAGRRWVLAGAGLLLVAVQILFLLPELAAAEPLPTWTSHAPTLSLLDANVLDVNPSMAGYISQINSVRPQLVTLEEATPTEVGQLVRSGALDSLPYRYEVPRSDPGAFFVASRYPLTRTKVVSLQGRPLIVQTTLQLPSGPQPLWVVHTTAPLPISFSLWKGMLATVVSQIEARGPSGLLVVGDFNATWGNRGFRAILHAGMTDGAAARGRAFDMTWSQIEPVVPPLVRIDHVLTGSGLAVTQLRSAVGTGSDHRDLIATVAIRRTTSQR